MLGVDAMKGFSRWKEESSLHSINNNMLLIGMSANASVEDQNEAFEAGMHFFASKPVSVEFINLLMKTILRHNFNIKEIIPSMSKSIRLDMDTYCNDSSFVRENKKNRIYRTGKQKPDKKSKESTFLKRVRVFFGWG